MKLDENESVERVSHSTPSRLAARRDRFVALPLALSLRQVKPNRSRERIVPNRSSSKSRSPHTIAIDVNHI